jgi:hypothetical protein
MVNALKHIFIEATSTPREWRSDRDKYDARLSLLHLIIIENNNKHIEVHQN